MNDIEKSLQEMQQQREEEERISGEEYSLEALISDLKKLNKDLQVQFDNQSFPKAHELCYAEEGDKKTKYGPYLFYDYNKTTLSVFDSWRGNYNLLSMRYSSNSQNITVGQLLEMSEFVNQKYLCGYKGGDYLMDLGKAIYVANSGCSQSIKLIGIKVEEEIVVLQTRNDDN